MRVLCLGEALVDLVCEQPVASLAEAPAFVPHFGGATANVAVAAAAAGADVALAGGVGDDAWGGWLVAKLAAAGVDLSWFVQVPEATTPVAFVSTDAAGEPSYQLYAEGLAATLNAVADQLPTAVEACDGIFFSTNTLAGETERELTMAARARALELGRPVCFDPNLRLHRWPTAAAGAAAANACVEGALLVRANRVEAELMTGERDPERAANAILKGGARMALVTLGAGGALLRGAVSADVDAAPANVVSTVGAGDALMGFVLGRLVTSGFYPPAVAASLPEAMVEAARATERWGATA
jgi:fructokinase